MQLSGTFLQRTQHVFEPLLRRLQLELAQALLDGGLVAALIFFGPAPFADALLLRPQVFLNDALLCHHLALGEPPFRLDRLEVSTLLCGQALLSQHL